jgi:anti-sigma regulatory factor (Ser/Thr protein kinase)
MREAITLRSDAAEFSRLQAFADQFAHKTGLSDDERSRLLIILEELFANAVTHGRVPHRTAGTIIVVLGSRMGRLWMSFTDDGRPFDPLAFREPELEGAPDRRAIGGLGIHIVRSLVHRARYRRRDGRNHLYLVRRIGSHSRTHR